MMQIFFASLLVVLTLQVWAQEKIEPVSEPVIGSAEEVPVFLDAFEIFPEKWTSVGFVDVPFYSFYLGTPRVDGVAFLPNFNPDLGISLGYKAWTLKFIEPFHVLPDYEVSRRGNSTKQEFILGISWHQYAMDMYYQYYKGFYLSTPLTGLRDGQPARYAQLPDTQVHNAGFNGYYVLNPKRYSIGAAFSHDEFQFKSGGSVLFSGYFNRLNMNPGLDFIPGTSAGAKLRPQISDGVFWSVGAAAGYGYTYSYQRFYVTGQALLGFGPQYQELNDKSGAYTRWNAQMKINAAIAIGINRRYDFAGLQTLLDSIYAQVDNGQLASSLVSAVFFYGRRF